MAGAVAPFFTDRPGVDQGRLENPSGWDPVPEESHVLCLGSNTPGQVRRFVIGDYLEISQNDDPGAAHIVRFLARIRGPERMPALSGLENFALVNGQTLQLRIDYGSLQTITFVTAQFAAIGAARAHEVRDAINSALIGATAELTGTGEVAIWSEKRGRRSRVEVVGGTANAALGFQELAWQASIRLDGTFMAQAEIWPGETRDLTDWAGNLATFGNPVDITFRLETIAK